MVVVRRAFDVIIKECEDLGFCLLLGADIVQDKNFKLAINELENREALLNTDKEAVEEGPPSKVIEGSQTPTKAEQAVARQRNTRQR